MHDAFQKEFLKLTPDYAASVIIDGIKIKKKKILILMIMYDYICGMMVIHLQEYLVKHMI